MILYCLTASLTFSSFYSDKKKYTVDALWLPVSPRFLCCPTAPGSRTKSRTTARNLGLITATIRYITGSYILSICRGVNPHTARHSWEKRGAREVQISHIQIAVDDTMFTGLAVLWICTVLTDWNKSPHI